MNRGGVVGGQHSSTYPKQTLQLTSLWSVSFSLLALFFFLNLALLSLWCCAWTFRSYGAQGSSLQLAASLLWAAGAGEQAQQSWLACLVALQQVESSWTRD